MKESIANSMVLTLILTVIIILICLLSTSISYTKAFKVKNFIVDTVEEYHGWNKNSKSYIDSYLAEMGYRTNAYGTQKCSDMGGKVVNEASNYRYCVVEFSTYKGKYYKVQAFMYFDIPVINQTIEIPVSGETKIMNIIE